MIAAGVALFVVAFIVARLDLTRSYPLWLNASLGFVAIGGICLAAAGIIRWLWKVAP